MKFNKSNLILAMVVAAGMSGAAVAATPDFREWVQTSLGSVYKGPSDWLEEKKDQLLIELRVLSPEELQAIDAKYQRRNGPGAKRPEPKISKETAEKVVAGLQFLQAQDMVLVERGSMGRDNVYRDRTGVMSRSDFNKIFRNRIGHNLVGSTCFLDSDRKKEINCDYKELISFMEFAYEYDSATKKWVTKFPQDSLEAAVVRRTGEVLSMIYSADPYSQKGPRIRTTVGEKLAEIVTTARNAGPSASDVVSKLVEQAVIDASQDKKATEAAPAK